MCICIKIWLFLNDLRISISLNLELSRNVYGIIRCQPNLILMSFNICSILYYYIITLNTYYTYLILSKKYFFYKSIKVDLSTFNMNCILKITTLFAYDT